jgi:hypothetical protein
MTVCKHYQDIKKPCNICLVKHGKDHLKQLNLQCPSNM